MKLTKVALSLSEQVFASGFTFCLFLAAARLLDQPSMESYTALFSLNQSFSFFLFGLVLQPIASSAGKNTAEQLGISIVLLFGLLMVFALFSPLAMHFFASFEGRITPQLWLLSLSFFTSQCIYEASRWLVIRLKGPRSAFVITATRFALFFVGILWLGAERLNATGFVLAQVMLNMVAAIGFAIVMREVFHEIRLAIPDRRAIHHFANLGTSMANFITNLVTVALVDRGLGGIGLAAFQALRSATNPIGLVSQVIDNHFSAELARSGSNIAVKSHAMRGILIVSALLLLIATLAGPHIVDFLYGQKFSDYWVLLPLLLMASLAHALTRPIFVSWRLTGNSRALNLYSLLLLLAVLPAIMLLGWAYWTFTMIAVFSLLPLAALVANRLCRGACNKEPQI